MAFAMDGPIEPWRDAFERHFEHAPFVTGALKEAFAEVFLAGWRAAQARDERPHRRPSDGTWDDSR